MIAEQLRRLPVLISDVQFRLDQTILLHQANLGVDPYTLETKIFIYAMCERIGLFSMLFVVYQGKGWYFQFRKG